MYVQVLVCVIRRMAILLLLHCSMLLMLVVMGNWSDQLMERVIDP